MQLPLGCCWFHRHFGKAYEASEASCKGNMSTRVLKIFLTSSYTNDADTTYMHTWTEDAGWCIMLHRCTSITLHILVWRSSTLTSSIVANCALDAGAVVSTFRSLFYLAVLLISNKAVLLPLPCYWSLSWAVCGPKTCTTLLHSNWEWGNNLTSTKSQKRRAKQPAIAHTSIRGHQIKYESCSGPPLNSIVGVHQAHCFAHLQHSTLGCLDKTSKVPRHSKATAQVVTPTVPGLASDGEAASRNRAMRKRKFRQLGWRKLGPDNNLQQTHLDVLKSADPADSKGERVRAERLWTQQPSTTIR